MIQRESGSTPIFGIEGSQGCAQTHLTCQVHTYSAQVLLQSASQHQPTSVTSPTHPNREQPYTTASKPAPQDPDFLEEVQRSAGFWALWESGDPLEFGLTETSEIRRILGPM